MKGLIIFVVIAAAVIFAWGWFQLDYYPTLLAEDFVEELRLGIDGGVLGSTFAYTPPLPERQLAIPKGGIGRGFKVERQEKPGLLDPPDSRVIRFSVRFDRSEQALPGRAETLTYRLVMIDKGDNRFMPDWQVFEFRPVGSRPLRRDAATGGARPRER